MSQYKRTYLASEEAELAKKQLEMLENNPQYNTQATYRFSTKDNLSFVEGHLNYLSEHPNLKTNEYLSNFKLKTKIR